MPLGKGRYTKVKLPCRSPPPYTAAAAGARFRFRGRLLRKGLGPAVSLSGGRGRQLVAVELEVVGGRD